MWYLNVSIPDLCTFTYFVGDVLFKQFLTGIGVKQLPGTQVNFLPIYLKVKLEFTLVLLNPFLKILNPDQLVSFRSHLIRIPSTQFSTLIENTDLKTWEMCYCVVKYIKYSA